MARERAQSFTRRSIKTASKLQGLRLVLSMIDLTTLEGADSPQKIKSLCKKAVNPYDGTISPPLPSVAAVCVYPSMVRVAKRALKGTDVKIASVATGFPSGQFPLDVRLSDVQHAVNAGADEIDMVINRGAFLSGDLGVVSDEITSIRKSCGKAHLKIILETGELETLENIRAASDLAISAAANAGIIGDGEVFIKTSTGKIRPCGDNSGDSCHA